MQITAEPLPLADTIRRWYNQEGGFTPGAFLEWLDHVAILFFSALARF